MPLRPRLLRLLECGLLFGVAPLLIDLRAMGGRFMPLLLALALGMGALLVRDPTFRRSQFGGLAGLRAALPGILGRWLLAAPLLVGLTVALEGQPGVPPQIQLFAMPRQMPALWPVVMIAYPLLSVYPQEILFRAWFFHRYTDALGGPRTTIVAGGLLFGWAHILFQNPAAVLLCIPGGLLFGWTYWRHRSLLASSAEHALYGDWIFTVGLGWWFYGGSVAAGG